MDRLFANITQRRVTIIENRQNSSDAADDHSQMFIVAGDEDSSSSNTSTPHTVILRDNKNCKILLPRHRKFSRVQVLNCQNCQIVIDGPIMTATLEIIDCENNEIHINGTNADIGIVTLDNARLNKLVLGHDQSPPLAIQFLSCFQSFDNSVQVRLFNDQMFHLRTRNDVLEAESTQDTENGENSYVSQTSIQYISRFFNHGELRTERAVREGCGYVTTDREKKINEEKQRRLEEGMERLIAQSLGFSNHNSSKPKAAPRIQPKPRPTTTGQLLATSSSRRSDHGSLLQQVSGFNRQNLKPTETVVTQVSDLGLDDQPVMIEKSDAPKEIFDSEELVRECAKSVAQKLKQSQHACVYTGAGISTSARIPDYRGPQGIWTLRDQGRLHEAKTIDIEQAYPTYSHYALTLLLQKGYIKRIISTNVDGLHRRSGCGQENLSELHGNSYREVCATCRKEYLRGYDVCKTVSDYMSHVTGRVCSCGGQLKDTIIHFTESLSDNELNPAIEHARKSDMSLVLGTSMQVRPACALPTLNPKSQLVIVNLMTTPYDSKAELVVHAKTDSFMELVMKELGLHDEVDMSYDELQVVRSNEPSQIIDTDPNKTSWLYQK